MEETKPKKNFIPLIALIAIVGIGAAVMAKPSTGTVKPDSNTATAGLSGSNSNLFGSLGGGNKSAAATFCEKDWPETGTPNIPNFGEGEHVCGNPNAKLVVVEYTDLECPFCKDFHPTLQKLVSESNGQVAWVLRHYPIPSLHPRAPHEAEAAECAYEQGGNVGFWKYADKVFEVTSSNNSLSPELLVPIAVEVGLEKEAFAACLDSGKYVNKIVGQAKLAEDAGPIGTPNSRIFVNGKQVEEVAGAVDYNQLKSKVDLWLKTI